MGSDPHYVTGIQAGRLPGDEIPLRLEFDQWWFSKELVHINQRTLVIRALLNWQAKGFNDSPPDDLSYFGIAGIHGLPLTSWPANSDQKQDWYCAHGNTTFATWHTPYLMLFEQQLYREMKALIPETFDDSQHAEFEQAADSWRLPFWDWAMKKPTWAPKLPEEEQYQQPHVGPNVPFAFTQAKVEVRAEKTSVKPAVWVDNPFFHFSLKKGTQFGKYGVAGGKDEPYVAKCRVTSRWPSTTNEKDQAFESDYVNGENQDYTKVTGQLQGSVENRSKTYFANSLPEAVLRLMTTKSDTGGPAMIYEKFVTSQWSGGGPKDYPSLEAIHNNLHNFVGGDGYMADPATSAFDPIFWLHHCNVDRLLAIWQELYPAAYKKWLDSGANDEEGKSPNTDLIPFKDAQGSYYTSISCSYKHKEFNYTYPELQSWKFEKREDYIDSIYKVLERQYSYSPKASLLLPENFEVTEQQMASMTPRNLEVENFPAALIEKFPLTNDNFSKFGKPPALEWGNDDYLLNVLYEPFALGGDTYSIVVYLGDIPDRAESILGLTDFRAEGTAISTVYNFSNRVEARGFDETGCESCKRQQSEGVLRSGQVILTDYLIERMVQGRAYQGLTLASLNEEEVLPYLKANLHWVVQTRFGRIIANDDERMGRLRFSVARGPAVHNSDPTRLSQYGPYTDIWNVTATGSDA